MLIAICRAVCVGCGAEFGSEFVRLLHESHGVILSYQHCCRIGDIAAVSL